MKDHEQRVAGGSHSYDAPPHLLRKRSSRTRPRKRGKNSERQYL